MTDTSGLVSYISGGTLAFLGIICIIVTITKLMKNCNVAPDAEQQEAPPCQALSKICVATVNPDGSFAVACELDKL